MSRILAVVIVIAALGVVIATRSSNAAGPARAPRSVVVSAGLRRQLRSEIKTLRLGQPTVARRAPAVAPGVGGVPCYVAGGFRCSEIPCTRFARVPAVPFRKSSTVIAVPGARRRTLVEPRAACIRHAPGKLVRSRGRSGG
ncbi:MAG TPA: hypothetical protein VG294_10300 [Solirubrobacteraceae bacterium]|jgi:hypothetical protein|nr:hypothetical protein [Solirubrobacteraceae bacterium]